ncbi:MAG: YggS family pyridoxal phosphate-dependent enzyme [Aestuariivirga sp.]|nr:YggS family pyridoxal phosphate-dependent enzyme [Aestuariivirga sp.]
MNLPRHRGLQDVRTRLETAAQAAGRKASEITLIAVSKTFGAETILPVLQAGQMAFGENRVQEAAGKWPALRSSAAGLELHLIGPLQSNKAADAVRLFDAIHTIDRPRIAQTVAAEMAKQARQLQLFIQVNTGDEKQKAGVSVGSADSFIAECRNKYGLHISGLMCIPPINEAPDQHFALLAHIARRNDLTNLSMGMSGDFETAIKHGATHVRVGSAIFGTREGQPH